MTDLNSIEAYDYHLPEELIAQHPVEPRDHSRLLVYRRADQSIVHRRFHNLPEYLRANDCLIWNQTRVVPARLYGRRAETGGKWEGLFLKLLADGDWEIIGQTRGKLKADEFLEIPHPGSEDVLQLKLIERREGGCWIARPETNGEVSPWDLLDQFGSIPLPPYIQDGHASESDRERYQTVYAQTPGAVAAPTAGLHFTPELIERCQAAGVDCSSVTLHVGLGTFRPVSVDNLDAHQMHREWCEVTSETVGQLQRCYEAGGRRIAVGTTTVRTLETASRESGQLQPWDGESDLFIRPGYQFRSTDGLITNFHLPKSTLLIMLSAMVGREEILRIYEEAISEQYRFYSYGDAMLIL